MPGYYSFRVVGMVVERGVNSLVRVNYSLKAEVGGGG